MTDFFTLDFGTGEIRHTFHSEFISKAPGWLPYQELGMCAIWAVFSLLLDVPGVIIEE